MLCHYILFYGTHVGKVVGKATRECGCCLANASISSYVIFPEMYKQKQTLEKISVLKFTTELNNNFQKSFSRRSYRLQQQ